MLVGGSTQPEILGEMEAIELIIAAQILGRTFVADLLPKSKTRPGGRDDESVFAWLLFPPGKPN